MPGSVLFRSRSKFPKRGTELDVTFPLSPELERNSVGTRSLGSVPSQNAFRTRSGFVITRLLSNHISYGVDVTMQRNTYAVNVIHTAQSIPVDPRECMDNKSHIPIASDSTKCNGRKGLSEGYIQGLHESFRERQIHL